MFVSVFVIADGTVQESTVDLVDGPLSMAIDLAVAAIRSLQGEGYELAALQGDGRHEAAFLSLPDGSRDACVTVSPDRAQVALAMEVPMAS